MRTGLILGRAGTGTTAALWQAALGSGREAARQGWKAAGAPVAWVTVIPPGAAAREQVAPGGVVG